MSGGEISDQALLRRIVIKNSFARNWKNARLEWDWSYMFQEESQCACKHRIFDNCVIVNRRTGKQLIVGNVCIGHFERDEFINAPAAHKSLKKLIKNPNNRKMNVPLLEFSVECDVLTQEEMDAYTKMTKGDGSICHYQIGHHRFRKDLYIRRRELNGKVLRAFGKKDLPPMPDIEDSSESSSEESDLYDESDFFTAEEENERRQENNFVHQWHVSEEEDGPLSDSFVEYWTNQEVEMKREEYVMNRKRYRNW